jgi:hypothetical protein
MTFMTQDEKLIATDARGRVRVPAERREALLDEFERSGLSGVKFAQQAGVNYKTFGLWVRKRRAARESAGGGSSARPVAFAEAVCERSAGVMMGAVALTIELPGGARVQVHSPLQLQLAAELLRMIGSSGLRGC